MLTLYAYPPLFGAADNNPYGLKVHAFLRLCGVGFRQVPIFDATAAPRGQLPYIEDSDELIGDSDAILAHVIRSRGLAIDVGMTPAERAADLLVRRTLDDLYWVMSYSRWKDPRYWPLFRDAMLREHPNLAESGMEAARAYNSERYRYQGIGRYEPDQAYARGLADLDALAALLEITGGSFLFGATPRSTDAGLYGFLANIQLSPIATPLKARLAALPRLGAHFTAMRILIEKDGGGSAGA